MQFPESWLREFCNPPVDTQALADLLTMAGLEVEELRPVAPAFSGVVVAHVLDVAKHPKLVYRGELQWSGGDKPTAVKGELTLRGVTKPLTLQIKSFTCMEHPFFKKPVCGADAEAQLDRADWGMSQYTDNGMGKILVRIQVEAFKDKLPEMPK